MKYFFISSLILSSIICKAQRKIDTIRVGLFYVDTTIKLPTEIMYTKALEVREEHWSGEGIPFAGDCGGCYQNYMKHVKYLQLDKKEIPKNWLTFDFESIFGINK